MTGGSKGKPGPPERVALVVGGASGIGQAVAGRLADAGYRAVVADLHRGVGAPEGQGQGQGQGFVAVDVTSGAGVDALFREMHEGPGDPDVVVISAGRGIHERLDEGDPEKWREVIEVNLLGALRVARAFVPAMRRKGAGDVVFISSVTARSAFPYGGVYGASKAGLEAAAEALRLENLPGIRVTTVVPGVVDTPFLERLGHRPQDIGWGALEPADVAGAVMYALEQPRRVAVGTIVIRPAGQPL